MKGDTIYKNGLTRLWLSVVVSAESICIPCIRVRAVILACRCFSAWRTSLLIVKPETVLRWHRASRQLVQVHVRRIRPPNGRHYRCRMLRLALQSPRFLIYDRDGCYGASFDRRVGRLGIVQVRTPFRSPRANAIAERWVKSFRTECPDHLLIVNERHLQKVMVEYVEYFNRWRPHRSIGQRAPGSPVPFAPHRRTQAAKVVTIPVLAGFHHVYQHAL